MKHRSPILPFVFIFLLAFGVPTLFSGCGGDDAPAPVAAEDPDGDTGNSSTADLSDDDLIVGENDRDATGNAEVPADQPKAAFVAVMRVVDHYLDGSLKQEWNVKKFADDTYVDHGPLVEFYPSGSKLREGKKADGKLTGVWTFWHQNGRIAKKGEYAKDIPQGKWEVFRRDGTLEVTENYDGGKPNGKWLYYHEDGTTVQREEEFRAGKKHGQWVEWYEPKAGQSTQQKKQVIHFEDDVAHGERIRWSDNGQMTFYEQRKAGKRHGEFKTWDENGTPLGEFYFVDGKRAKRPESKPGA